MSSVSQPVFTGVSSYANDLQQVITRAVNIASLPLQQAQNELTTFQAQQSSLNGLNTAFTTLQAAVQNLTTAIGSGSYAGTSSDPSSVGVSVSSGALEGTYTVAVSDPGSYSTSITAPTLPAVSDPNSSSYSTATTFYLTVNGKSFTLNPSASTASALVQSINASGAGVQASLVNTGGPGSPNYQMIVRSTELGADSIQLNDGTTDLLNTLSTGNDANYTVNGLPTAISSNSRTVTLAPGVTLNLLQATSQPATVTVSRNGNSLQSALNSFIMAYNAAVDGLDQQTGQNAGALLGQAVVRELRTSLSQIVNFSQAGGSIVSLAQMGVNLGSDGHLTFDGTAFGSQSIGVMQSFLGDGTAPGFLLNASGLLNTIEQTTTGTLPAALQAINNQITNQNSVISADQDKINQLQTTLTQQMAAADAAIASLESKKTYLNNLFTAMLNYNLNGAGVSSGNSGG